MDNNQKVNPIIFMGEEDNQYKTAQICEIAYIAGALNDKKVIDTGDRDLEEMLVEVYKPLFDEWEHGMDKGAPMDTFKTEEEQGYISAYAQRRLVELYPSKNY